MNPLALYAPSALPALPVRIGSLDGLNLDLSALKPRQPGQNGERAIVMFRSRYAPERLPFRRHYWLKSCEGGYTVMYAWNLDKPRTDIPFGKVEGDDLAAIRIVIGNQAADHRMTPIRWELYEDREGEELVAMGRFDAWSLLQGVAESDIHRLAAKGQVPNLERWDYDDIFMDKPCPGCGASMSVNTLAYNIDSARCAKCGKRPFLSPLITGRLERALPSFTRGNSAKQATECVLDIVDYLGFLGADIADVVGELPGGLNPHAALKQLHASSTNAEAPSAGPALARLEARLAGCDQATRMTAMGAAILLRQAVERGRFEEADAAAVNLLRTILRRNAG
jgi:hypothetical protein